MKKKPNIKAGIIINIVLTVLSLVYMFVYYIEQLKQDVTFPKFVRIVESLQAAVDQIPIKNAFEELETERSYYQEKRKESNERLIDKKARIGKAIGFAPMVLLFVGYLIVPMVGIGIVSMGEALNTMKGS